MEENIELFGASGKTKNKDKKEKSQKEEKQKEDKQKEDKQKEDKQKENTQKTNSVKDKQETDSKDKKKKSVENTGENQVKEPEWNIRMVNAVTEENTELPLQESSMTLHQMRKSILSESWIQKIRQHFQGL